MTDFLDESISKVIDFLWFLPGCREPLQVGYVPTAVQDWLKMRNALSVCLITAKSFSTPDEESEANLWRHHQLKTVVQREGLSMVEGELRSPSQSWVGGPFLGLVDAPPSSIKYIFEEFSLDVIVVVSIDGEVRVIPRERSLDS
jgi:hypothetical protein